jgi:RHS repeat-associated protein
MIAGTGSSGTLLLSATYDSFGKRSVYPTTYDGDIYDSFGAQWGYRVDSGTGFELLGHRFYDEANGRFINRDPISYDGGIDLYEYGGDNATNAYDPTGYSQHGPNRSGGNDPLFSLTCEELQALEKCATGPEKRKIQMVMKLICGRHSRASNDKPKPKQYPVLPPVRVPRPAPAPRLTPEPGLGPEPIPESVPIRIDWPVWVY